MRQLLLLAAAASAAVLGGATWGQGVVEPSPQAPSARTCGGRNDASECPIDGDLDAAGANGQVAVNLLQASQRALLSARKGPFSDRKRCHTIGGKSSKCLPDLMFLGVSKGGSTSIVAYMLAHPQVVLQTAGEGAYGWSVNRSTSPVGGPPNLKEALPSVTVGGDKNVMWEAHVFDRHLATDGELIASNWATAPRIPTRDVGNYLQMHYTPNYFYFPDTPFHIAQLYSNSRDIKYFVILREPVARAVSSWKFHVTMTFENRSFHQAITDGIAQRHVLEDCYMGKLRDHQDGQFPKVGEVESLSMGDQKHIVDACFWGLPNSHDTTLPMETPITLMHAHVDKGVYVDQLRRWFKIVGRQNVFVMSLEEWAKDPLGLYGEVARFAGYEPIGSHGFRDAAELDGVLSKEYNDGGSGSPWGIPAPPEPTKEAKEALGDFYAPYDEALFELVGRRMWEPWAAKAAAA